MIVSRLIAVLRTCEDRLETSPCRRVSKPSPSSANPPQSESLAIRNSTPCLLSADIGTIAPPTGKPKPFELDSGFPPQQAREKRCYRPRDLPTRPTLSYCPWSCTAPTHVMRAARHAARSPLGCNIESLNARRLGPARFGRALQSCVEDSRCRPVAWNSSPTSSQGTGQDRNAN